MVFLSQDLLTEARQRLGEIAKDPAKYSSLLEGLILQVIWPTAVHLRRLNCVDFVIFSLGILSVAGAQSYHSLSAAGCRNGSGENHLTVVVFFFLSETLTFFFLRSLVTNQAAVLKSIPIYKEAVKQNIDVKVDKERFLPSGMWEECFSHIFVVILLFI